MENTIISSRIYDGKVINLRIDKVELPSGEISYREIVEHCGAVCIVPITEDGNIVLVSQFRKPVEEKLLELPAGKLEKDEQPEECAFRELAEETGYRAGRMEYLFSFYTSPGFSDEILHLFVAEDLSPGDTNTDSDEIVEVIEMSLAKAVDLAVTGQIKDAKTVTGILAVHNIRHNNL